MKRHGKGRWYAILIFLAGCAVAVLLLGNEEEAHFSEKSKTALTVETVHIRKRDYCVQVPAWGFVEPRETIDIRPEIAGKVTEVPAGIFAGAIVKQGDLLFSIDDREYLNTLEEAKADTEQAWQALEIEKGRQAVARSEWEVLADSSQEGSQVSSLALREPQLKEKEAAVQKATARQAQAALDVERTRVTAPCDGVVLGEDLAKGQVLDAGYAAMQIACTDCYQVTAFFSQEYALDPGSPAAMIDLGPDRYEGTVKSFIPRIDPETRQRQALVTFDGAEVGLGAYASLTLAGPSFSDVAVIPEEALRADGTVWVLGDGGTLEIRNVTVLAQDPTNVVIGQGLTGNEHVILSHIASPLAGMALESTASPDESRPENLGGGEQGK
jgi:RND family efflux transporter MFP subunit